VVVMGCGPIGLLAAAAAKAEGARAVMVTGTSGDEKQRLATAMKMGMDYAVNVEKQDALALVKRTDQGAGPI